MLYNFRMSSSGTLHKYFKQPTQSAGEQSSNVPQPQCIILDEIPIEEPGPSASTLKRKGGDKTVDRGKRRKLSLSTLRVKQSNIALPCSPSPVDAVCGMDANLPDQVKEKLKLASSPVSEDKELDTIQDCHQSLVASKEKKEKDSSCHPAGSMNLKDSDSSMLKICKPSTSNNQNENEQMPQKVNGSSLSSPRSIKDVLSYSKSTCSANEKVADLIPKTKPTEKSSRKNKVSKIETTSTKEVETKLKVTTKSVNDEDSPIKMKRRGRRSINALADSEDEHDSSGLHEKSKKLEAKDSLDLEVVQLTSSKEQNKLETSVGRRSMRTRKPVERFTIVSDKEDEGM